MSHDRPGCSRMSDSDIAADCHSWTDTSNAPAIGSTVETNGMEDALR